MRTLLLCTLVLCATPAFAINIDLGAATSGNVSIHTCTNDGFCEGFGGISLAGPRFTLQDLFEVTLHGAGPGRTVDRSLGLHWSGTLVADGISVHTSGGGNLNLDTGSGLIQSGLTFYTFTAAPWIGSIVATQRPYPEGCPPPLTSSCFLVTYIDGDLHLAPPPPEVIHTPEPATWLLLAGGLALLWLRQRRVGQSVRPHSLKVS